MRFARLSAAALATVAVAVTLSACGPQAPTRDEETGEVTEASDADVFAVAVGDCLNSADLEGEITSIPTVPCAEPHDSEIYASTTLPDGDYPGDEAVGAAADEYCLPQFETFVGVPYESSAIYYWPLTPSQMSWEEADDREVMCIAAIDPETEEPVTGTLEGANR